MVSLLLSWMFIQGLVLQTLNVAVNSNVEHRSQLKHQCITLNPYLNVQHSNLQQHKNENLFMFTKKPSLEVEVPSG